MNFVPSVLTVITAYDCNSSYYECKGPSFITKEMRRYLLKLTAVSLEKFTISPLGFEESLWCKKCESENFKKSKLFSPYFIFVTH